MTSDPAPRASFPAGRSSDERDVLSPRPERGEGRDEAARLAHDPHGDHDATLLHCVQGESSAWSIGSKPRRAGAASARQDRATGRPGAEGGEHARRG